MYSEKSGETQKWRKKMREKPVFAPSLPWKEFKEWADSKGIGECQEDWEDWWECWMMGYRCREMNVETKERG